MKHSIAFGVGLVTLGLAAAGCSTVNEEDVAAKEPELVQISLELQSLADLPTCNASRAGTTAYVSSPAGIYRCIAGLWLPLLCANLTSGTVAFASMSNTLYGCVSGTWQAIALPPGPQGPQGNPGPQGSPGPQGPPGASTLCQVGEVVCGPQCVNLSTSSEHCGACGHSCLGDPCSAGQCQPVLLAPRPNQGPAGGLALDDAYVYVTNQPPAQRGHVLRVPKTGGPALSIDVGDSLHRLAVGGDSLYVSAPVSKAVVVVDRATATVTASIPLPEAPLELTYFENRLYVTSAGTASEGGRVMVVDTLTNSMVSNSDAGRGPSKVTVGDGYAWWVATNQNLLVRGSLATAEPNFAMVVESTPRSVQVHDGFAYIAAGNNSVDFGTIRKYGFDVTSIKTDELLASGQSIPRSLVLDGDWVYWVAGHGLLRVSRFGGAPTTLSPQNASILSLDATHAYFIDTDGVKRLAK